jgi:hypothetical protein
MVGFSWTRIAPLAIALSAVLAMGCSDNDGPNNDPGPDDIRGDGGSAGDGGTGGSSGTGGSANTGLIGPEGGVVTGEQDITVTIPAGALDSETTITASVVEASGLPARPSGTAAAGPFVALTPHGTQFTMPVEVTLPYTSSGGSLTVLRIDDENDTTWEVLTGASFDGGTATVALSHFSILAVAAIETTNGIIGPEGGIVTGDGITVIIPPGALSEETPIGVSVIDGNGLPPLTIGSLPPTALDRVGPFVSLTPDGTYFYSNVTVTIPYTGVPAAKVLRFQDQYEPYDWRDITPWSNSTFIFHDEVVSFELGDFEYSIITLALEPCTSNDDCQLRVGDEVCVKDGCDGPGGCRDDFFFCDDDARGVCGCDGVTYKNRCEAADRGATNVATMGRCECDDDNDCMGQLETCEPFYLWAWFYQVPSCDDSLGCMVDAPISCPDCCPSVPLCGCDGVTYDCFFDAKPVGIAAYSACGSDDPDPDPDSWNELDQALGGVTTNGCEGASAAYTDLRGRASVTITDISAWGDPHNACIGVSAGTEVIWQGNFDTHPLVGGVSPTTDSSSPITEADASGTGDMAVTAVTLNATELTVEPYFCTTHTTSMGGVIAVFP